MISTLILSALLMGIAGSPHCVAMCSTACGTAASACGGGRPQRAMLALQLGRLCSYSLAGALVATSVEVLNEWGAQSSLIRPFWVMLHLAALSMGIAMIWLGRLPQWMQSMGRNTLRPVALRGITDGRAQPRLWRVSLIGAGWVIWPCGLLHSALIVAALASGAAQGAAVMGAFAVGSAAGLWIGPALWWRFSAGGLDAVRGPKRAIRVSGLGLFIASAWALTQDLSQRMRDIFC